MYYLLPQSTNLHLFKIRIQKQMGGTGLGYCKVSHNVVFIILLVQIFCLKCIYHFAGLLFSYLSFCRFTLLNIQKKSYHFPRLSFCRFQILKFWLEKLIILQGYHFAGFIFYYFDGSNLSFCRVIILPGKNCIANTTSSSLMSV